MLNDEDLKYLNQIVSASHAYQDLGDFVSQILENAINGRYSFAQPIDLKLRNHILKNRSGQKQLMNDVHPIKLTITSKMINKFPDIFWFLKDSLDLHSYWTIDNILNYIFTQIIYSYDNLIKLPFGEYEKLEFQSTKTDYILAMLKESVN